MLKFRHLLEANGLTRQIFDIINRHLAGKGLIKREEAIGDATLIAAPPSTENQDKQRDPEMHHSKKGSSWHFGMKAYISVHATSRVVRTFIWMAGNLAILTRSRELDQIGGRTDDVRCYRRQASRLRAPRSR